MAIGRPISLTPNIATKNISVAATEGQTNFTVTGGYRINEIGVFRNGVRLADGRDFAAQDGSIVKLVEATSASDILEFQVFDSFNVSDAIVSTASTQVLSGNLYVNETLYAPVFDGDFVGSAATIGSAVTMTTSGIHANNILVSGTTAKGIGIITATQFYGDGANITGIGLTVYTDTGSLAVAGIATFTGDVLVGSSATVGFGSTVFFKDGNKVIFGNGEDLSIFHDGSNSFIKDTGTGGIFIDASGLTLRDANDENYAVFTSNAQADLYYDNAKKFETTKFGTIITGVTTTNELSVSGVATAVLVSATDVNVSGVATAVLVSATDVNVSGTVTATTFKGDGSQLTGIGETVNVRTQSITVSGVSTFTGASNFNGDVNLGDATGDTITATGRFDSDLVPSTDNARDLGASGLEWKDLYIDGTANIDTLSADSATLATAAVSDLTSGRVVLAGSSGELQDNAGLTFADGNLTVSGNVNVGGTITHEDVTNIDSLGIITARSGVNVSGGQLLVGTGITFGNAGVATFSENVDFNKQVSFKDGSGSGGTSKLTFGNSDDLNIYHDGSHSYIKDSGTGNLKVLTSLLSVKNPADDNVMIQSTVSGSVDLYYNNTKRFETSTTGATITGEATATAGLIVGSGVTIGSAGVSTFSNDVRIASANGSDFFFDKSDNSFKIGDSITQYFGSDNDLWLMHNGSTGYISNTTGDLYIRDDGGDIYIQAKSGENSIVAKDDGSVEIYYDDSKKFETNTNGISVTGTIDLTSELNFNTPAHKYIDFYTKASDNTKYNATIRLVNHDSSDFDNAINMEREGRVQLYHAGNQKFETTNDGVVISGIATASVGVAYTGLLRESFAKTDGKLSDNTNIDLEKGMIHYFTTEETTTCTPNIRYNSSKTLNNMMNVNDAITVTVITTADASGYSANWQIDGNNVTEQWIMGSAPSAGGSDGYDIYSFTILKLANASFQVIGNLVNAT